MDARGRTVLCIAAEEGHMESVQALLQAGVDASLCNSDGRSPMHAAVDGRHMQVVALLAPHCADAADMNRIDARGRTVLCIAAEEGHMESVQALLQAGADVNTSDADGKSPLWWAACKGHTEVMEALLTHGADVGSPDEFGDFPMDAANRNPAVVKLLAAHGAKPPFTFGASSSQLAAPAFSFGGPSQSSAPAFSFGGPSQS